MSTHSRLLAFALVRGLLSLLPAQEKAIDTDKAYASMGYPLFGSVLFTIGDVNRDGCNDFVIADPAYEEHPSLERMFWILSGVDGKELARKELAEAPTAGSCTGDMNGDGVPDLVFSTSSGSRRGLVAVSGKTGASLWSNAVECAELELAKGSDARRDLDGDGASDVLMTVRSKSDGLWRAAVYSGKNGSALLVARDLPTASRSSVGWVEDSDGDGAPDLVLARRDGNGAGLRISIVSGRTARVVKEWAIDRPVDAESLQLAFSPPRGKSETGMTYVSAGDFMAAYVTTTGRLVWETKVEPIDQHFPSISLQADLDSDGVADLVLGWPECRKAIGRIGLLSGRTGDRGWMLEGPTGMSSFGRVVGATCDRNGDSTPELLIGCDNGLLHEPGCVLVVSGRDGTPLGRLARRGNVVVQMSEEMK
jgi:hypothetical protein